jgi:Holliday junction DNA helicase RuvA
MIGYLKGKIIISRPGVLIIEANGVGYKVTVSKQIDFFSEKKEYELFIHHHIKEDISDLYGFEKYGELELFEKLLSVNGVGPKAAMTIISMAPAEKIIDAIVSEDSRFFQSASGIGKKAAFKIILELKSKISNLNYSGNIGANQHQDIYDGLGMLGYKKQEIDKIIVSLPKELKTSEEKIRWCLKNLSKS